MTTPIEMPIPLAVNSKKFDIINVQLNTPVGSGFIQTLTRAKPYWAAEYQSPPLGGDRENAMRKFLDTLEGSAYTFIGYDPRRPVPYAYRHLPIGSAPWGAANVTAGNFNAGTLQVTFTNSTKLTAGDYIQISIGNAVHLFRCAEDQVGTNFAIKVRPRPPTFGGSRAARLIRAGAEMKLIGNVDWNDSVDSFPSVKFQAVQYIDRTT